MKRTALFVISTLLLLSTAVGCGYGTNYNMNGAAAPRITQLSPQNVVANSGAFTLTVEGTGFTSGSVVYWGTTPLAANFDSSVELTVAISATMVANSGTVTIYVHSSSGNSNTMMFNIS